MSMNKEILTIIVVNEARRKLAVAPDMKIKVIMHPCHSHFFCSNHL